MDFAANKGWTMLGEVSRKDVVRELHAIKWSRVEAYVRENGGTVAELMTHSSSELFGNEDPPLNCLQCSRGVPVANVTEACSNIGAYLCKVKGTATHIIEFAYGTEDNPKKMKPMRERSWTVADILDAFHFLRAVEDASERDDMASRSAELTAALAFTKTEEHYTYTLDEAADDDDVTPEEDGNEIEDEEIEDDDDSGETVESAGDTEPHFTTITYIFVKNCTFTTYLLCMSIYQ